VSAEFQDADLCALPYPDDYFEYVFCVAVLHHLPTPALRLKAMQELARVLAPSGKLFMTNWNLWRLTMQGKSVWNYMFSQKRQGMLKGRGFQDVITFFGDENTPLYYHAFRVGDLRGLAKQAGLSVEKALYVKQGVPAHWWSAPNSMLTAKKRSC
jgi:SAM-dependent methyltransferase